MKKTYLILGIIGLLFVGLAHKGEALNIYNPLSNISSSSISGVAVTSINGVTGAINSSTANTDLPFLDGNNVYTGLNKFTGTTNVANLNTRLYFPSPVALAAGSTCGNSSNATTTEVGTCLADYYAVVASSSPAANILYIGNYDYASSTFTNAFAENQLNVRMQISCIGGGGSEFDYGGATNANGAFNFNAGNLLNGWGMSDCKIVNQSGNTMPGIVLGGSNGAGGITLEENRVSGFSPQLQLGNNLWIEHIDHNFFNNGQALLYNATSNAGENVMLTNNAFFETGTNPTSSILNCVQWNGNYSGIHSNSNSFDGCQETITTLNGWGFSSVNDYFENTFIDAVNPYDFIDSSSSLAMVNPTFTNDASNSVPVQYVGMANNAPLSVNGLTLSQNSVGGAGTGIAANFATYLGLSSHGAFTFLGPLNEPAGAAVSSIWRSIGSPAPTTTMAIYQAASSTSLSAIILSEQPSDGSFRINMGGNPVLKISSTGQVVLGGTSNPGFSATSPITLNASTSITGSFSDVTPTTNLITLGTTASGIPLLLGTSTISLGGTSLALNTCTSTVTNIPFVLNTSTDIVDTEAQTQPGGIGSVDYNSWISGLSAASSSVTTEVCGLVTAGVTPTASKYNIQITKGSGM